MKKLFFAFAAFFAFTAAFAQTQTPAPAPEQEQKDISKLIAFAEMDHDFGKIPHGKPAEFELVMKNVSGDSVRIENIQVGCGCTTPKWQPGPYAPGESFKAVIGFNGSSEGEFHKQITVFFTGGYSQVIKFHGQTFKAPDNAAPGNGTLQKMKNGIQ